VMFVYREEYYLKTREPDPAHPITGSGWKSANARIGGPEVLVEKHRHGATNKIDLHFDDRFTRFSNFAPDEPWPRLVARRLVGGSRRHSHDRERRASADHSPTRRSLRPRSHDDGHSRRPSRAYGG